ncbi:hypothetical protein H1C71_026931, partial [Ictidomys tridecemlineatus]
PSETDPNSPPRRSQESAETLPCEHAMPGLQSPVVLTPGPKTTRRRLLLFRNWLVTTKQRSTKSFRSKEKLPLSDLQAASWDREELLDDACDLIPSRGNSPFLPVALDPCVTEFQ